MALLAALALTAAAPWVDGGASRSGGLCNSSRSMAGKGVPPKLCDHQKVTSTCQKPMSMLRAAPQPISEVCLSIDGGSINAGVCLFQGSPLAQQIMWLGTQWRRPKTTAQTAPASCQTATALKLVSKVASCPAHVVHPRPLLFQCETHQTPVHYGTNTTLLCVVCLCTGQP